MLGLDPIQSRIVSIRPSTAFHLGPRPVLEAPEVEVRIRLDAKTVNHLRDCGLGWETRVNALSSQLVANGQT